MRAPFTGAVDATASASDPSGRYGLGGGRHLAKVNGWTPQEAERYIAAQFALWQRRSAFQWTLDLSWLEENGITVQNAPVLDSNRV
jgi:hypothetical protein